MAALTPKQEAFCQSYVQTGSASEAYRAAYSAGGMKAATVHKRASELLGNGAVTGRLSELRGAVSKAHGVTVASLILELEEARKVAKGRDQAAAMVQATMGKAKLVGLDKDASEDDDNAQPVRVDVTVTDARKRAEP